MDTNLTAASLLSQLNIPPELTPVGEEMAKEAFSELKDAPFLPSLNRDILASDRIKAVVDEYAKEVFESPQQARSFITNKLLEIATCGDARHELRALELLGKLSDIGAFSEKSEVIVTAKSSADIDRQIKEKVNEILQKRGVSLEKIIEAEVIEVKAEPDELDEVIKQRQLEKTKSESKAETIVEDDEEYEEEVEETEEDDESA